MLQSQRETESKRIPLGRFHVGKGKPYPEHGKIHSEEVPGFKRHFFNPRRAIPTLTARLRELPSCRGCLAARDPSGDASVSWCVFLKQSSFLGGCPLKKRTHWLGTICRERQLPKQDNFFPMQIHCRSEEGVFDTCDYVLYVSPSFCTVCLGSAIVWAGCSDLPSKAVRSRNLAHGVTVAFLQGPMLQLDFHMPFFGQSRVFV